MAKPPHPEDEYFAKIDLENLKKFSAKKRAALKETELKHLKELHANHCPSCGLELSMITFKGYVVRRCFHCGGGFLEKEALEALCGEEHHLFDKIMEIFRF